VSGAVQRLLDRDGMGGARPPKRSAPAADAAARADAASAGAAPAGAAAERSPQSVDTEAVINEAKQFQLTPEKLGAIAELNDRLEAIGPMLAAVPVFTAAVGNGTSPLTVPSEDGRKLAYFFMEHADAEAFLGAVRENIGVSLEASVIGVSLADIIRAYSTPEAREAKESYVVIPTMAEVVASRHIMRQAGKAADAAELGPGSGLVPVFWSEALAVQSAGGKQRKVLFFKLRDLQQMWTRLADARKEKGEIEQMPDGPTVQVSDLQTMSGLLVAANKTDDAMFMPSSSAMKYAQGAKGAAADGAPPPAGAAAGIGQPDVDETDVSDGFEAEEEEEAVV
jgi:hypothetical protein